jgi:hypothetical protein
LGSTIDQVNAVVTWESGVIRKTETVGAQCQVALALTIAPTDAAAVGKKRKRAECVINNNCKKKVGMTTLHCYKHCKRAKGRNHR